MKLLAVEELSQRGAFLCHAVVARGGKSGNTAKDWPDHPASLADLIFGV